MSVREIASALSVSRATVYSLIKAGQLKAVWIGASLRVPATSLDAYVEGRRR